MLRASNQAVTCAMEFNPIVMAQKVKNRWQCTRRSQALVALSISIFSIESSGANFITNCEYEVTGTTVPASSGTPTTISNASGTVISANFFNSGAIDPPYFDGAEFVSVCVTPFSVSGSRTAEITTDVGLDNDFIIKGYPQFVIGTKFGNIYETSFRYYSNTGLPEKHRWPVLATGTDTAGQNFQFANLQYVSTEKGIGLPAFTNALPEITIKVDIDEYNVRGSERDVMLESWFYDTSTNSTLIGNNTVTGEPIAGTLDNIVGIGHPHYQQLNNTLLEMMVHVGSLSPHDVSEAKNNPGQYQLTENYSGKDFDGDGIDDHFDVDSHAFLGSNNPADPSAGIYSSGIDNNNDGIDDADLLPVTIGDFAYSIWYGETFLSPVIIFSRETNSTLKNDFDPLIPDMNLTEEGEITLPWNDFLEFTLNEVEDMLQNQLVSWAIGSENPFPRMSSPTGAIGGVELGVEPQINNSTDSPYSAVINKFEVTIDDREFGLSDTTAPTVDVTSPTTSQNIAAPTIINLEGTAQDKESGVKKVLVRIKRSTKDGSSFWNGTDWQKDRSGSALRATFIEGLWILRNVNLSERGSYRITTKAYDFANNVAAETENPISVFTVGSIDSTAPSGTLTTPETGVPLQTNTQFRLEGTATDNDSGVKRVYVRIQNRSTTPRTFWNGTSWQESRSGTGLRAVLSGETWTLDNIDLSQPGNYRTTFKIEDKAGNVSTESANPVSDFTVTQTDR